MVQDRATTARLRRGPVPRSLVAAAMPLGVVATCGIVGFGGGDVRFQVLTVTASFLPLPIAVYLLLDPSAHIGVESPKLTVLDADTVREGSATWPRQPSWLGRLPRRIGQSRAG